MNKDYSKIGLYPHNINGYEKVIEGYKNNSVVSVIRATGTGKTYIGLQLALDNNDKKTMYFVPSYAIIEHITSTINDNPNLDLTRDFPNLDLRVYQSLVNMSYEEIKNLDVDILILDEFHHLGAPVWGARIKTLIETHPNIKIFGMTAYTVRDRNTPYERDMINPYTNELFSNTDVSHYDICDGMINRVLPLLIYRSAWLVNELYQKIEEEAKDLDPTLSEDKKLLELIKNAKRLIQKAPSIIDVIKQNIIPDGKYIYFCPPKSKDGKNDIDTIMQEAKEWFLAMGLKEEDIIFYKTTSKMRKLGKQNRDAFYYDVDLEGNSVSNKLRVMFAINQYNEGVHAPNVNGVIMGRYTSSDIVYFEELGRALSVKGDTLKKYEEYQKYSLEELLDLCKQRKIYVEDNITKAKIINKLLSPVVIDLVNNIGFIKELENNLKDRIKEISKKTGNHRDNTLTLKETYFDIVIQNEDLFTVLNDLSQRLANSWDKMYEYAKQYYEHYGNLEVPQWFKTNNGYDYDENGKINLGAWIACQRLRISPTSERGQKLLAIGMRFENKFLTWDEMYEYAKIYYEHHGNLEVPYKFKTNNGYEYDENGKINLGQWINRQRQKIDPTSERGQKLLAIGMRFENKICTLTWDEMYEYAKIYYEKHGNLEVPQWFKTNNGYEYDENGKINLGLWIVRQRHNVDPTSERGQKLLAIGMRFENKFLTWDEMYELAKKYYEKHGNLEVPHSFKTNNGYEYSEHGKINLGPWVDRQRQRVDPTSEHGQKLLAIGMRFENKICTLTWDEMYELAKKYYEKHGNLEVSQKFKTNNGYEYDENGKVNLGQWINRQRQRVDPTSEHGQKLLAIGMRFENKFLTWDEMYELAKKYYEKHGNLEVPHSFKTNNGYEYSEHGKINLGFWIATQRQSVAPTSERGQKLLAIGMRFENKICTLTWDEMYELAKLYYEHHGNLKVPSSFKTNNGYEYDENGKINLGKWIVKQREKVIPTSERGQMLIKIGMVFSVRKNKEDVKIFCLENNIDLEKNKITLNHISIQELVAKTRYLKEQNIDIVDANGLLHEIYSMSNVNMQVKYNISLEVLIDKYYLTYSRK